MWATCDDYIETFVDGVEQPDPNKLNWYVFTEFKISDKAQVVAIYCMDYGGKAYIAASFSNGRKTDRTTWKCTNVSEVGWTGHDFDDSHWEAPVMEGYGPYCCVLCNS